MSEPHCKCRYFRYDRDPGGKSEREYLDGVLCDSSECELHNLGVRQELEKLQAELAAAQKDRDDWKRKVEHSHFVVQDKNV